MTGGSLGLGIRSGSYGSLQQQALLQQQQPPPPPPPPNGSSLFQIVQATPPRKPGKMFKDKEKLFHRFFKFAGRKSVGMLFLCLISLVVFLWVIYVDKGENTGERPEVVSIRTGNFSLSSSPTYEVVGSAMNDSTGNSNESGGNPPLVPLPMPTPPAPREYFLGYTLPPGHPCNSFTLPPPPADKKRTGPRPCPVCYLPVEEAIALMPKFSSPSPVLQNLTYIHEETLSRETEFGGSEFGGYPTLRQRTDSYDIRESMSVHCGFVKGSKAGHGTGFDIDDSDLLEMDQCSGVVVASAIFGNFDELQQPKNISEHSKKTGCFFLFVDEETDAFLRNSSMLDSSKRSGLWRVVVVRNLPYKDARRNGKIPKLLLHRMFPNARYSLWIDGKLELVVDPYQILERFLWRKNATFAISRHYRRFDVFVEAEANKAAAKYDNASIDFQIEFYKKEGLTPYSKAKLPITSDVPEGCVIVREHVPISNLFTCLWFNEVDRFTSRDQISFSTVRDKITAKTNWTLNMFLDCERRNFVVQKYHRGVLKQRAARVPVTAHPPPLVLPSPPPPLPPAGGAKIDTSINVPVKKAPARHGREKRTSRRHRKVAAGNKDNES